VSSVSCMALKKSLKNYWRKEAKIIKGRKDLPIKYSQNFLKDSQLVAKLVSRSTIKQGDLVYEIGPGKGIIVEQLLKVGAEVVAIEKDKKLCEALRRRFKNKKKIKIICGDFLKFQLPRRKAYKIFSNIPFFLTADIIRKITSYTNPPQDAYLIVQEEPAKKFAGFPYGKERQYSLLLKPWFILEILYHFKPTDFYPVPGVDVVLLRIKRREKPLIESSQAQLYRDFVVYGFNQWQPNLKKALKRIFTYKQFQRLARELGFELSAKPTDLDFKQWLGLFKYFLIGTTEHKKKYVNGAERKLKIQQKKLQKIHRSRSKDR